MDRELWVLWNGDESSQELLAEAGRLTLKTGMSLCAVSFAPTSGAVPCGKIYEICGASGEADCRGRALAELAGKFAPEIILASYSESGTMSVAAALLGAGLTADCTELEISPEGRLIQTRPALGGNLMAVIKTEGSPQMATVRPGSFPHAQPKTLGASPVVKEAAPLYDGVKLLERVLCREGRGGLLSSQVVIAGGLGIGSAEGFSVLCSFAERMGGRAAASRAAVNAGFAPYSFQVGLSGISIRPKVYIALGISGAVQHMAGIRGAESIIAVNTDPKAPIFRGSDLGVLAHWREFIDSVDVALSKKVICPPRADN